MGKVKEKKLNKDIKELEEIEQKEREQFFQTRDRLLDYSAQQRRSNSHLSNYRIYYTPPDLSHEKESSKVTTKLGEGLSKLALNSADIATSCIELLIKKNQDYGPDNINNAPGGALNGLNVRLYDKVSRLNNLLNNNKEPNYESIRDTFVDIVNYGIISLLILDNKWETTK